MFTKRIELDRYNEEGKKFIHTWISKKEVVGVKQVNRGRFEDLVFYKNENGGIHIAMIPQKHVTSEPCFFGDIDHLIRITWAHVFGYKLECLCMWHDPRNTRRIERAILRMIA